MNQAWTHRGNDTPSAFYEPDKLAEMFLEGYFVWDADEGKPAGELGEARGRGQWKLKYWRGDFYSWHNGRYTQVSDGDIKVLATGHIQYINKHYYYKPDPQIKVTTSLVENILLNTRAIDGVYIPDWRELNSWSPSDDGMSPDRQGIITISFLNGLVMFDKSGHVTRDSCLENSERRGTSDEPRLIPHTPAYFSMIKLPYNYDKDARCPRWEAFIDDVMQGDSQRATLLQEWAGYLLVDTLKLHKFLLLAGEGGNGKTVFTTILERMVGEQNVSHIPLCCFGDRFSLASTLGKMLNSTSESSHGLTEFCETTLKSYTSGDRMTFERKFREPVSAHPTAKVMISTNQLPSFTDKSNGIWRRLLFVPFDKCVPIEEQNPELVDELTTELPGIFNWAFEGLRKLMADGRFVEPTRCTEAIAEYRKDTNPVRVFAEENCETGTENDRVPCGDLYRIYKGYCDENGYQPLNASNFGKEVKRAFPKVEKIREQANGKRIQLYKFLAFQKQADANQSKFQDCF